MSKKTKILWGFSAVLLVLMVRWWWKRGGQALHLPVAQVEAMPGYAPRGICSGRPKALAESYLSVLTGGRLETMNVRQGDMVSSGQILGMVDQTARAAKLKAALSNFRLAQKEYARVASLFQSGTAAREEYDKTQSNLEVKRAELEGAKQVVEDGIMRAPIAGRVSTIVFKIGDRVPDGGRILAIEAPGQLQMSCRIPVAVAEILPSSAKVLWQTMDDAQPKQVEAEAKILGQSGHGGFVGIDREIQLVSESPQLAAFEGHLVEAQIPLPVIDGVVKLPSDAVVKREGDYFVLTRRQDDDESWEWQKIEVLKRDAEVVYLKGLSPDKQVLRVDQELSVVEAKVQKGSAKR